MTLLVNWHLHPFRNHSTELTNITAAHRLPVEAEHGPRKRYTHKRKPPSPSTSCSFFLFIVVGSLSLTNTDAKNAVQAHFRAFEKDRARLPLALSSNVIWQQWTPAHRLHFLDDIPQLDCHLAIARYAGEQYPSHAAVASVIASAQPRNRSTTEMGHGSG